MKLILLSLLAAASVSTALVPRNEAIVPLPSQDDFYSPPSHWKETSPGDILRVRQAPGNLTATFTNAAKAYNVLFRSTDTNYMPTWGFTTLFVPSTQSQANISQLLSYQIPYNTPDVDAGPTTLLYGDITALGLIYLDIQNALSKGWHVNVPDHEGPYASFLCGVQEGHATLDSIRAVSTQLGHFKRPSPPRVALWGYSGGSYASEMALELQIQYAPEMSETIVGAALGGTVPNISASILNLIAPGPFNGLVPAGLVGFATQHLDVEKYLLSELKTSGPVYNASNFLTVRNMSIEEAFVYYADQTMVEYFKSGIDFFNSLVLQTAFARDAIESAHGLPQVPMFVYKAIGDEIANVTDTDSLVNRYCEFAGMNILYERNTIGNHLGEYINGDARALAWLESVLDGTYNHTGCTIRDVVVNATIT